MRIGRTCYALGAVLVTAMLAGWPAVATAQLSRKPNEVLRVGFEASSAGPYSDADAARFLTQATFGATPEDLARLRQLGYVAWIDAQMAAQPSYQVPFLNWVAGRPAGQNAIQPAQRLESWFINALGLFDPSAPLRVHDDALRQRVALALSEIFVVSDERSALSEVPWATASYYDMLVRNAFGNYRALLEDVTLHPAMGVYLSMLGNRKPDPQNNTRPDENYAREILQLFSIGLYELHPDGTRRLESGHPIATYGQDVVRSFAHVFTGWHFSDCDAGEECAYAADDPVWRRSMHPIEIHHDSASAKQLLNYPGVALPGGLLAAGGDARQELEAALDNVANHPNVGPFISRQLIQRLVTSNPTPAYVQRVAAVFDDNGQGVRGDLGAVTRAILLDVEARFGHTLALDSGFGKLREPLFKLTQLWRLTHAASINGRIDLRVDPNQEYGMAPLRSATVFNFYRPDFQPFGEIQTRGWAAPEFQVATDRQLVSAPNDLYWRLFYFHLGSDYFYAQDPDQLLIDYTELMGLASTPAVLVDRLDLLLMSGQMSPYMRDVLLSHLGGMGNPNAGLDRVQQALYLILSSPEYSIQK